MGVQVPESGVTTPILIGSAAPAGTVSAVVASKLASITVVLVTAFISFTWLRFFGNECFILT